MLNYQRVTNRVLTSTTLSILFNRGTNDYQQPNADRTMISKKLWIKSSHDNMGICCGIHDQHVFFSLSSSKHQLIPQKMQFGWEVHDMPSRAMFYVWDHPKIFVTNSATCARPTGRATRFRAF